MSATLWLSPNADETLYDRILAAEGESFGRQTWVLLPTRLQIEVWRETLMRRAATASLFNLRFFSFYDLYDHLLNLAHSPQRTLPRGGEYPLLRHLLAGLKANFQFWGRIAETTGFVSLASDLLLELKQGLVLPETFTAQAQSPKDHDFALLYHAYQDFLTRHGWVDRDGAGWVALSSVRDETALAHRLQNEVGLLVAAGFDDFTPLQAGLLAQLARHVPHTLISLLYEESRAVSAYRNAARTRQRLLSAWEKAGLPLQEEIRLGTPKASPPLHHLERGLFSPQALPPLPAEGVVEALEAPNLLEEVRAVLRHIKGRLLAGTRPQDILIALRDPQSYAPHLRRLADHYGLPLQVSGGRPLLEAPPIRALLSLLDLAGQDFPRRPLLETLTSPYFDFSPFLPANTAAVLEVLSLRRGILGGRKAWLTNLAQAKAEHVALVGGEEDEASGESQPHVHYDGPAWAQALEGVFDLLTPPPQAEAPAYIAWLEGLCGTDPRLSLDEETEDENFRDNKGLAFYACALGHTDDALGRRDAYTLAAWGGVLHDMLAGYRLLEEAQQAPLVLTWAAFRADLQLALAQGRIEGPARRGGQILAVSVLEGRGLPTPEVYILGLYEGGFPQAASQDPLYDDSERADLENRGIDLRTAADRLSESGLFYALCALAQERLVLSRPLYDEKGDLLPPSLFWKAVLQPPQGLLSEVRVTRTKLGQAPQPDEAMTEREALVALSAGLSRPHPDTPPDPDLLGLWASVKDSPLYAHVAAMRLLENRRAQAQHGDPYGGWLDYAPFVDEVRAFMAERTWSATSLNDLAACPYGFFAKYILKLSPYEEPQAGLTILQRGTLYHAILQEAYTLIQTEGLTINPAHQDRAKALARQAAERVLADAPAKYGLPHYALWEQEKADLTQSAESAVSADFSADSPIEKALPNGLAGKTRRPWRQELHFGDKSISVSLPDPTGQRGELRLHGSIDRVDKIGDSLLILDYKSGTAIPTPKQLEAGENFQMLVYLQAARTLFPEVQDFIGLFFSLQSRKASQAFDQASLGKAQAALSALFSKVEAARAGAFPNWPAKLGGGKCRSHCPYWRLCRPQKTPNDNHFDHEDNNHV